MVISGLGGTSQPGQGLTQPKDVGTEVEETPLLALLMLSGTMM